MTLSGKLTKWQQRAIWLRSAAFSLFLGGLLHWMFLTALRGPFSPDPVLRVAALAFGPFIGATGFALTFWLNRDVLVEFTCDDRSFRFRKFGSARVETRDLSEIAKVSEMARNATVTGYYVQFRDGRGATVSVSALPDGLLIGDWLRSHRTSTTPSGFVISSSPSAQAWQPPEELTRAVPRRIRLTSAGIFWGLITVFVIVAGGDGSLWFASYIRGQEAEVNRMFVEGQETEGIVTRLVETHGRGPHYTVHYRYSANGVTWDARPANIRKQHWKDLRVGSLIAVRYLPSDPSTNILSADPPHVQPFWFPIVLFPLVCAVSSLICLMLLRARRYLAYGVPAPARVIHVTPRPGSASTIDYQFPLAEGSAGQGSCLTSDPPPEGSIVCIVYDPKNPSRNTLYPITLAKLATR